METVIGVKVRVEGEPQWPPRCACCGDVATETTRVFWTWPGVAHIESKSHWVPACPTCAEHRRKAVHRFERDMIELLSYAGAGVAMLVGFAIGVWAVLGVVAPVAILITVLVKSGKRRNQKAHGMLTSKCMRADFVAFQRDTFTFASIAYAEEFAILNKGTVLGVGADWSR